MAVTDLAVPGGCPARLYRPDGAGPALTLFLHGGGFVIGDLDTHDRACRRLADRSRVSVLALDYRLAPEHPWPAAVDDAVAALRWIASGPAVLGRPPRPWPWPATARAARWPRWPACGCAARTPPRPCRSWPTPTPT